MERAVAEFFRGTWKPPPSDMQTSPPSSVCTGEGAKGSSARGDVLWPKLLEFIMQFSNKWSA